MSSGLVFRPLLDAETPADPTDGAPSARLDDQYLVPNEGNPVLVLALVVGPATDKAARLRALKAQLARIAPFGDAMVRNGQDRPKLSIYWADLPDTQLDKASGEEVQDHDAFREKWLQGKLAGSMLETRALTEPEEARRDKLFSFGGQSLPYARWLGHADVLPVVLGTRWSGDDAKPVEFGGFGHAPYALAMGAPQATAIDHDRVGPEAFALARCLAKLLGLGDEGEDEARLSGPDHWARSFPNLHYVNGVAAVAADLPWQDLLDGTGEVVFGGLGVPADHTDYRVARPEEHCLLAEELGEGGEQGLFCKVCTHHLRTVFGLNARDPWVPRKALSFGSPTADTDHSDGTDVYGAITQSLHGTETRKLFDRLSVRPRYPLLTGEGDTPLTYLATLQPRGDGERMLVHLALETLQPIGMPDAVWAELRALITDAAHFVALDTTRQDPPLAIYFPRSKLPDATDGTPNPERLDTSWATVLDMAPVDLVPRGGSEEEPWIVWRVSRWSGLAVRLTMQDVRTTLGPSAVLDVQMQRFGLQEGPVQIHLEMFGHVVDLTDRAKDVWSISDDAWVPIKDKYREGAGYRAKLGAPSLPAEWRLPDDGDGVWTSEQRSAEVFNTVLQDRMRVTAWREADGVAGYAGFFGPFADLHLGLAPPHVQGMLVAGLSRLLCVALDCKPLDAVWRRGLAMVQCAGVTDRMPPVASRTFWNWVEAEDRDHYIVSARSPTLRQHIVWSPTAIPVHLDRLHHLMVHGRSGSGRWTPPNVPGADLAVPTATAGSPVARLIEAWDEVRDQLRPTRTTDQLKTQLAHHLAQLEASGALGLPANVHCGEVIDILREARRRGVMGGLITAYGSATFQKDLIDAFKADLPTLAMVRALLGEDLGWDLSLKSRFAGTAALRYHDTADVMQALGRLTRRQLAEFNAANVFELVRSSFEDVLTLGGGALVKDIADSKLVEDWAPVVADPLRLRLAWPTSQTRAIFEACRLIADQVWNHALSTHSRGGDASTLLDELEAFWKLVAVKVVRHHYLHFPPTAPICAVLAAIPWQKAPSRTSSKSMREQVFDHLQTVKIDPDSTTSAMLLFSSFNPAWSETRDLAKADSYSTDGKGLRDAYKACLGSKAKDYSSALETAVASHPGKNKYWVLQDHVPFVTDLAHALKAVTDAVTKAAVELALALEAEGHGSASDRRDLEDLGDDLKKLKFGLQSFENRTTELYVTRGDTPYPAGRAITDDFQVGLRVAAGIAGAEVEQEALRIKNITGVGPHALAFLGLPVDPGDKPTASEVHTEIAGSSGPLFDARVAALKVMSPSSTAELVEGVKDLLPVVLDYAFSLWSSSRDQAAALVVSLVRDVWRTPAAWPDLTSLDTSGYVSIVGSTDGALLAAELGTLLTASTDEARLGALRRMCSVKRAVASRARTGREAELWKGLAFYDEVEPSPGGGHVVRMVEETHVAYPSAYLAYVELRITLAEEADVLPRTVGPQTCAATTALMLAYLEAGIEDDQVSAEAVDVQLRAVGRAWLPLFRELIWPARYAVRRGTLVQMDVLRILDVMLGNEFYSDPRLIRAQVLATHLRRAELGHIIGDVSWWSWMKTAVPQFVERDTRLALKLDAFERAEIQGKSASIVLHGAFGEVVEATYGIDKARQEIAGMAAAVATTVVAVGAVTAVSVATGGAATPFALALVGGVSAGLANNITLIAVRGSDNITSADLEYEFTLAVVEGVVEGATAGLLRPSAFVHGGRLATSAAAEAGEEMTKATARRMIAEAAKAEQRAALGAYEEIGIDIIEGLLGGAASEGLRTATDVTTYNRGWAVALGRIAWGALVGGALGAAVAPVGAVIGDAFGRLSQLVGPTQAKRTSDFMDGIERSNPGSVEKTGGATFSDDEVLAANQLREALERRATPEEIAPLVTRAFKANPTEARKTVDLYNTRLRQIREHAALFAHRGQTDLADVLYRRTRFQTVAPDSSYLKQGLDDDMIPQAAVGVEKVGGEYRFVVYTAEDIDPAIIIEELEDIHQLSRLPDADLELLSRRNSWAAADGDDPKLTDAEKKRFVALVHTLEADSNQALVTAYDRRLKQLREDAQGDPSRLNTDETEEAARLRELAAHRVEEHRRAAGSVTLANLPDDPPWMHSETTLNALDPRPATKGEDGKYVSKRKGWLELRGYRSADEVEALRAQAAKAFNTARDEVRRSDSPLRNKLLSHAKDGTPPANVTIHPYISTRRPYARFWWVEERLVDGKKLEFVHECTVCLVPGYRKHTIADVRDTSAKPFDPEEIDYLGGLPSGADQARRKHLTSWLTTHEAIKNLLKDKTIMGTPMTETLAGSLADAIGEAPLNFVRGTPILRIFNYRRAWNQAYLEATGKPLPLDEEEAHHLMELFLGASSQLPDLTDVGVSDPDTRALFAMLGVNKDIHSRLHGILGEESMDLDVDGVRTEGLAVNAASMASRILPRSGDSGSFQGGASEALVVTMPDGSQDYLTLGASGVAHVDGEHSAALAALEVTP